MRKIALLAMAAILVALLAGCAGGEEADQTPPVISGILASDITQTGATITWTTNEPATNQVEYGLTTSYGSTTNLDENLATSHSVSLSGLTAGTTYHYRVKSEDASGNEAVSGDRVFTTLVSPDTTPPTISQVTVSSVSDTAVTITWTTDEGATSQVVYSTVPLHSSVVQPSWTPLDENLVTSHSVAISGLTAGTVYYYWVTSKDDSGNEAVSGDDTFSTSDTAAPTITQVNVSDITESSVTITWITDEPATSQVEYGQTISYGLSTTLDESLVTSHSISLGGLTPETTYHLRVRSEDGSANEAISGDYDFTTLAYWPTEGWRTSTPEAQGLDSEILADMLETIQSGDYEIESITIIRNGYLVLDAYVSPFGPKSRHDIRSCAKSINSALVGIAIDKGYIEGVDQRVLDFFPERTVANIDANKEALTLEHLLTMSTGWECEDPGVCDQQMWQTEDWVQHLLDMPVAEEPGTQWQYLNTAAFLLSAIISETTGMNALAFAEEHLFGPLGITDVEWWCNARGITHGYGDLYMSPQDMAKFGYLYLKGGLWEGEQVVSSDWVEASTRIYMPADNPSVGYGYQWWIANGLPYAAGSYGQYILLLPGADMVVVFTSDVLEGSTSVPWDLFLDFIVPAIKSSIPLPENPEGVALLESLAEALVNPEGIEHGEPASVSLRIRLTTTSSWTNFDLLYGATWAEANVVWASEEATHALFSWDSESYQDNFALDQPYERAEVGGMVELIADVCLHGVEQWETLVFEIKRGGIGWTEVKLFSYVGDELFLIETLECSGDTSKCHVEMPAAALMDSTPCGL